MKKNINCDSICRSLELYKKASADSKEAARALYSAIATILSESGLEAVVITTPHPDELLSRQIDIKISESISLRLSGYIRHSS